MTIQSLSIVVPAKKCWNNCKFCVSRMRNDEDVYNADGVELEDYFARLAFARDNGCSSMVITGTTEPQQNMEFVRKILEANRRLPRPFYHIDFQTTGSGMKYEDFAKLREFGVTTISISLSAPEDEKNWDIHGTPKALRIPMCSLFENVKQNRLNLRLSINMTEAWSCFEAEEFFRFGADANADQITIRKLYSSGAGLAQDRWIAKNHYPEYMLEVLRSYILENGTHIRNLPYGLRVYSVHGISVAVDDDCMSKDNPSDLKYVILRPNGKLYCRWDDKGSLIF